MKRETFIQQVATDCISNGISLILSNKSKVRAAAEDPTFASTGYFCAEDKELVVGTANSGWFEILVHEYCHFLQWKEGKFFEDQEWIVKQNNFWEWLEREIELEEEDVIEVIRSVAACEIDCETRAIQILKKIRGYNKKRIKSYIRASNTYIYFYGIIKETRSWYKTQPYENSYLNTLSPSDRLITVDEVFNPPPGFSKLAKQVALTL